MTVEDSITNHQIISIIRSNNHHHNNTNNNNNNQNGLTLMTQSSRSISHPNILPSTVDNNNNNTNNNYRCPHRLENYRVQRNRTATRLSFTMPSIHNNYPNNNNNNQQSRQRINSFNDNIHHHNALYRTKLCIQYLFTIAIRFIPILISTIVIICLLAFLINFQFALIIFNITLMIIVSIIIFFIIYTLIMYYIYRKQSNRIHNHHHHHHDQQQHNSNTNQMQRRNRSFSTNHLQHTNSPFTISNNLPYHDDDENECYNCRMERLKATDLPPPYDPPPKYEELNVSQLESHCNSVNTRIDTATNNDDEHR